MNDHDSRQLSAMLQQVEAYKRGAIDLAWLIASLESLRHALQTIPDEWCDAFWSRWGVLEEIYSISVVREQPIPDASQVEIRRSIDEITSMIHSILPPIRGNASD
jgi:hypothetical protein